MVEKLFLVVTVTALCMISPGPDMLLVMRNTLTLNRRDGSLTALGVLTGNLIHIGYCVVGIAILLSQSTLAYNTLRVAGAIYLVYLGIQGLRSAHNSGTQPFAATSVSSSPYRQGLVNNLLNPKGSLFYLGVFTQVITPDMPWPQMMLLVGVMVSVSALFWIIFVEALQLPVIRTGVSQWSVTLNRVFGVVLIAVGARVAMLN